MSQKPCKGCKTLIDKDASICPHCRTKQGMGFMKMFGIGLLALITIGYVASHRNQDSPIKTALTPEQVAAKAKKEALMIKMIRVVRAIKESSKNPDSFKEEKVGITADETICVTYKASNSFNAIIPGIAYEHAGKIMLDADGFKRHCSKPMLMQSDLY